MGRSASEGGPPEGTLAHTSTHMKVPPLTVVVQTQRTLRTPIAHERNLRCGHHAPLAIGGRYRSDVSTAGGAPRPRVAPGVCVEGGRPFPTHPLKLQEPAAQHIGVGHGRKLPETVSSMPLLYDVPTEPTLTRSPRSPRLMRSGRASGQRAP